MKVFIHDHIHRETEPEVRITLAEAQELYAQLFEVLFHCKPDREAIADASRPSEPITQDEIDAWLNDGGRLPDAEELKPKESA